MNMATAPGPAQTQPDGPAVAIRDLWLNVGEQDLLKGITMSVAKGTTVALVGPSGAGKTSLLRCVNHLTVPTSGEVWVNGQRIGWESRNGRLRPASARVMRAHRQTVGMVMQQFNLFANLDALGNVAFAPVAAGLCGHAEAQDRARALLERMGLSGKEHALPRDLSGGQQQRVAIARALAMQPAVLLFDEVTSALDPENAREVLAVMQDLAAQGTTMMMVTHEIGFACAMADQIVFMEDGRIVASGTPQALRSPDAPDRVRRFLGA